MAAGSKSSTPKAADIPPTESRRTATGAPSPSHYHGPRNAEFELRKAYNTVVETGVTYFWDRRPPAGVESGEPAALYKRAYQAYRRGDGLAAERWSRAAKHLARASWHEAKICYLEPRLTEIPYLEGASGEEYNLHERSDTTADLLNSVAEHVPPGLETMPDEMERYLSRGRRHLERLDDPELKHELLRAEYIKAAHEYGRVLELMALAYEAENSTKAAA